MQRAGFTLVNYTFESQRCEATRIAADGQILPERQKPRMWTPDEDHRLARAVAKHGMNSWKIVALEVGRRNGDQCCQRWMRALCPDIRKGRWSTEEDSLLYQRILHLGEGCWQRIAQGIPGRTDIQCRSRWLKTVRVRYIRPGQVVTPLARQLCDVPDAPVASIPVPTTPIQPRSLQPTETSIDNAAQANESLSSTSSETLSQPSIDVSNSIIASAVPSNPIVHPNKMSFDWLLS